MRSPRFLQLHQLDSAALVAEALAGLQARPAFASPKFFYDALGSRLFDAITELDEYYPTRTERAIFDGHGAAIAVAVHAAVGAGSTLVDLGAGNCAKAARLFGALAPARYVALDISVDFLRQSIECLQREHPAMEMVGVGLDFSARLALPQGLLDGPSLVFYPGSSIGNFGPDDALGVTAAFNLNLLRHLNRLLGADFVLRDWRHVASFDSAASRIEMHLEARREARVQWPGGERRFATGERLHTENSYKWQRAGFEALLRDAGFKQVQCWSDAQVGFAVMLARAA